MKGQIRFAILMLVFAGVARGEDWPMFRGARRDGIYSGKNLPTNWGRDKNIKWKADLPAAGNSSPIVSGNRVFVNCAQSNAGVKRSLFCFDRESGKQLWVKTVEYEAEDMTHNTNPYCASTPAADGKRVVVWHGSAGVFCYDFEGKELWKRDLGRISHIWGYGSSPVIFGDMVVLNCGPGVRTFVVALKLETGEVLWQSDEPDGAEAESKQTKGWIGSWSTPVVAKVDGEPQILVPMPRHVNAYDPKSGKIIWSVDGLGDLVYTDLLVADDIGVAMGGYGGPAIAFKLGGKGNVTESNRLWRSDKKNPQRIGSGVILDKHIFVVNDNAFQCLDLMSGKEVWKVRAENGTNWASLIAGDGKLYVTSQKGVTCVFAADAKEFRLLASNELGEGSNSTIAVADGRIYLRTHRHLWCIGE